MEDVKRLGHAVISQMARSPYLLDKAYVVQSARRTYDHLVRQASYQHPVRMSAADVKRYGKKHLSFLAAGGLIEMTWHQSREWVAIRLKCDAWTGDLPFVL